MKFSEVLYRQTEDIWNAYFDHPFIQGIADGSLDIQKFQFYMIQDYLYLWDYIKLFALGVLKSDDEDQMKEFSESLNLILHQEMDIHRGYMEKLGISEEEVMEAQKSFINLSYTNYMLSVSQKGAVEEVIAALLSCCWTYAVIGKRIDDKNPQAKEHAFYGDWIKGYSDAGFQAMANWYVNEIDLIGELVSEERKQQLITIFRNCCLYELKFWDMAEARALDFVAKSAANES